jgi:hypothetical protein
MIDTTIAADELRPGVQDIRRRTSILLACGVVAGPLYLVTAATQVATRDGFDLTRHPLSLLSLGGLGWIQVANFLLSGALYLAAAVGLRRVLRGGRGGTWAPRLLGAFGGSLIWAGVFPADPYHGFPAGTPADATATSWHGLLHNLAPAVGFLALVVAFLVLARRFRADGRRGWAAGSAAVAVLLLAPDLFLAQDYFTAVLAGAAVLGWGWASAVSARLLLDLRN